MSYAIFYATFYATWTLIDVDVDLDRVYEHRLKASMPAS